MTDRHVIARHVTAQTGLTQRENRAADRETGGGPGQRRGGAQGPDQSIQRRKRNTSVTEAATGRTVVVTERTGAGAATRRTGAGAATRRTEAGAATRRRSQRSLVADLVTVDRSSTQHLTYKNYLVAN